MKRILAAAIAMVMVLAMLATALAEQTATVKGGRLRLRASASSTGNVLASYPTGTVVTIKGTYGKWSQVVTPDGRTGYMDNSFLTLETDKKPEPDPGKPVGVATVVSENGKNVRMRSGPGTKYSTIGSFPVGSQATLLIRSSEWDYVTINGKTGYMMAKFLQEGGTVTPEKPSDQSYAAFVTSGDGTSVHLREGAGKKFHSLGTYPVGTEVTVLHHGTTWDFVQIGATTGYMMNKYLTTTAVPAVVRSVRINNINPKVGDTLSAVVTPAHANVTYEWKDSKGVLLSTAATCTLGSGTLGRAVSVTVTGVGSTYGTATSDYTYPVGTSGGYQPTTTTPPTMALTALSGIVTLPSAAVVGVTITPSYVLNSDYVTFQWYENGVMIATGPSLSVTESLAGKRVLVLAVANGNGYHGAVASNECQIQ